MKKRVILFAVVILLLLSFPLYAKESVSIVYPAGFYTLDPQLHGTTTIASIMRNVYETLVIRDYEMEIVSELARDWERVDEYTIRFFLREGVFFHNGETFDAHSVKYSLRRLQDPDKDIPRAALFDSIAEINILDDYTVDIVTSYPDGNLLAKLATPFASMIPPEYFQTQSMGYVGENPVGTGPYKFVSWVKDGDLVLDRYQDYWGEKPEFERAVIKVITEDTTRTAALLAGEVDIIFNVPHIDIPAIERNPDTKILPITSARDLYISYWADREPLTNTKIRQALNYAVDKELIIDAIMGGFGTPTASLLGIWHWGHNPDLEPYPYDPQKARELIAEAGYPEGIKLRFDAPTGRYPMDRELSEVIVSQLEEVGITITDFRIMEYGLYIEHYREGTMADLSLWGMVSQIYDGEELFTRFQSFRSRRGYFDTWVNEDFDRVSQLAIEELDLEKRLELYQEADRIYHEDPARIFLFQLEDIYGYNTRINWIPRPDEIILIKDITSAQ